MNQIRTFFRVYQELGDFFIMEKFAEFEDRSVRRIDEQRLKLGDTVIDTSENYEEEYGSIQNWISSVHSAPVV